MSEIDPELSRLYREASDAGPPPALDTAILAAARKQVAKSRRPGRSWWARWMAPASALATLAVAVSLAFLVEREQAGIIDETVTREVPPRPQSPAPGPAAEPAKPKTADHMAPAAAEKKEAASVPLLVPAARLPAQLPAAFPAPPAVPIAPAPEAVPRSTEPAPPAAHAFPAENRAKAVESRTMKNSNAAADAMPGAAGAAAPAAPAAAGKLAPLGQQAIPRSPEAWLEEIGRLKREGRDQEAAEQLAEFRRVYPEYTVPESLLK